MKNAGTTIAANVFTGMHLSAIPDCSNLIEGRGFSDHRFLRLPEGRVRWANRFLRCEALLKLKHSTLWRNEMTTTNTRRDDVIDWLNDAYAMERSLEVMLRKQSANDNAHRSI